MLQLWGDLLNAAWLECALHPSAHPCSAFGQPKTSVLWQRPPEGEHH